MLCLHWDNMLVVKSDLEVPSKDEAARVVAMLQQPKDPLSREHVASVDNIIMTVLSKSQHQVSPFLGFCTSGPPDAGHKL